MTRILIGKLILTFVLLGGAVMSFLLDWSPNHLLNPLWHPHARYHSAILLFLFAGVAGTATWLIWRRSNETSTAFTAAAILSLSYWTPFFYVPILLPGVSYWAGNLGHKPHIGGAVIYPNLIVVAIFAILTIIGWWLGRSSTETSNAP
jgi:tryptophan-rich sensory protein